jgi:DNA-binding beta-propeller fold protein YncE
MKLSKLVMKRWRFVYLASVVATLVVGLGIWNPLRAMADKNRAPAYKVDPFWPKALPDRWITGEVAGTCLDSKDHLFTINRGSTGGPPTNPTGNLTAKEAIPTVGSPSPPVIEFDRAGNVVNAWGVLSVLPSGLHGCYVDYQDNVWIGGNGDGIVQKYSHSGQLLLQIGTKGVCDGPCGETASLNSSHTMLNEPADMTVDPSNGDIYIADGYGNHRVVVFNKTGTYLRQWGSAGTAPGQFSPTGGGHPHCVILDNSGRVYACDRANDRVQVFTKSGTLLQVIPIKPGTGQVPSGIGSAWDVDFSADKAQSFLFDADGGNEVLWELDHDSGSILVGFGRPGHMAGDFTFLHSVAVDSRNNMFIGETVGGRRVQKFVRVGDLARATDMYKGSPHYDPRFPSVSGGGGDNDGDNDD